MLLVITTCVCTNIPANPLPAWEIGQNGRYVGYFYNTGQEWLFRKISLSAATWGEVYCITPARHLFITRHSMTTLLLITACIDRTDTVWRCALQHWVHWHWEGEEMSSVRKVKNFIQKAFCTTFHQSLWISSIKRNSKHHLEQHERGLGCEIVINVLSLHFKQELLSMQSSLFPKPE